MDNSEYLLLFLIPILSIFQSITGVGILVLGTPILIFFDYKMVEVMSLLLPLSVFNSLLNIAVIKFKNHETNINIVMKKYFFFLCYPSIFLGLFFLKEFNNFINFNLVVCLMIWISLLFPLSNQAKSMLFSNKFKKIMISLIGLSHGVTNSGGSLLSMFIVNSYNGSVDYIRYNIIFFYFFLALFQYVSIIIIFDLDYIIKFDIKNYLFVILGVIIGNFLIKKENLKNIKFIIQSIAFVGSLFLLHKSKIFFSA